MQLRLTKLFRVFLDNVLTYRTISPIVTPMTATTAGRKPERKLTDE